LNSVENISEDFGINVERNVRAKRTIGAGPYVTSCTILIFDKVFRILCKILVLHGKCNISSQKFVSRQKALSFSDLKATAFMSCFTGKKMKRFVKLKDKGKKKVSFYNDVEQNDFA